MKLVYMTGFEEMSGADPLWFYGAGGAFTVVNNQGRFGGSALTHTQTGGGEIFPLLTPWPANLTTARTATLAFAYKFNAGGRATTIARVTCSSFPDRNNPKKTVAQLGMDETNRPYIDIGGDGSSNTYGAGTLKYANINLLPNRYYHLQWVLKTRAVNDMFVIVEAPKAPQPNPPYTFYSARMLYDNSGLAQLYVDGNLVINYSGPVGYILGGSMFTPIAPTWGNNIETPYSMSPDGVELCYQTYNLVQCFDDLVLGYGEPGDTDFSVGDLSVKTLTVDTGATVNAGMDAWSNFGGASKLASVAELPPNFDTTYAWSGTVGAAQNFKFQNVRSGAAGYKAIMPVVVARKTDLPTRKAKFSGYLNGSPWAGSDFTIYDQYMPYWTVLNNQPAGSAWTETRMNQLEAGLTLD